MSVNESVVGASWTTSHPPLRVYVQQVLDQFAQQSLLAEFGYDPSDPLVVTVTFLVENGPGVTWRFGRDLLHQGLLSLSGIGDVQVWPTRLDDRTAVWLEVGSYGMRALFELPAPALAEWLESTYRLVPAGFEMADVNWEAVITGLLSGGGVASD